jgi:hypothetical protein
VRLWRHTGSRSFACWLVSWALVWPWVVVGVAGLCRVSDAQGLDFERKPLVVVFDFENRAGMEGALLGRQATDAVWVEMQRSGIFEMISRDQLDQEVALRDLKQPFDDTAMRMLAGALNATAYVYGVVTRAEVGERDKRTRAVVKMEVRMADRFSGELINGAVAEAEAVRPGYTGAPDLLVTEAVNKCASLIVSEIKARKMPSGQVLMVSRDEVLLNVGAAAGVKSDLEFVILRPRGQEYDVVGRCRATEMSNDDSHAKIIQNLYGIRPEDIVRAIYRMDTDVLSGKERMEHEYKKGKKGIEKLALPLLAALALYMMTKKSSHKTDEVRELEGGAANENDNGRNGIEGVNGPSSVLKWRAPAGLTYSRIAGFNIYRSPPQGGDDPHGGLGHNYEAVGTMVAGAENDLIWIDDDVADGTFTYPGPTDAVSDDKYELPTDETGYDLGVTPGTHYKYGVTVIYQVLIPGAGSDGGPGYQWKESSSIYSATITPLQMNPVGGLTVTPTMDSSQDMKDVHFRWTSVRGADTYAVQVSDDVRFPANRTWVRGPIQRPAPAGTELDVRVRNDSGLIQFAQTGVEQRLFWRVGGKYSRDNPGPVGAYVWSDAVSFLAQPEPPPPPG